MLLQFEGKKEFAENTQGSHFRWVTIGVLPDEMLLKIFSFYMNELDRGNWYEPKGDFGWRTLVHVCRRWRTVVFASPCRLDLRLLCTKERPVREMLDIWPALPISICSVKNDLSSVMKGADNIIAALEHNDRVCQISLCDFTSLHLEKFTAAMHKPFPVLMDLAIKLYTGVELAPAIPDSFLGGSASHLRRFCLSGVAFPALPKLLLSATDLVHLDLRNIPYLGYIPPEAMATCLSALTRLEGFALEFHSPKSLPSPINRRPPLPTRIVLPALTELYLQGLSEYLEDLISRIDVPLLHYIHLVLYNPFNFDSPQFVQFLTRTEKSSAFIRANLTISRLYRDLTFFPQSGPPDYLRVVFETLYGYREVELSSLARFCSSLLSPLSTLELLSLEVKPYRSLNWKDDMENPTKWLEFLHTFYALKTLYLDAKVVPLVARALQELVGERVTEVLPALQNIVLKPQQPKLSKPVPEAIEQFVAARQFSGHPVAVRLEEEESG